jgi:hypothetical protein
MTGPMMPGERGKNWAEVWGPRCDNERGLRLRAMWEDPHTKHIAKRIADTLGVTKVQVQAAVVRFKLKRAPHFAHDRTGLPGLVRKHSLPPKAQPVKGASTLPPLPSQSSTAENLQPCATLLRKTLGLPES